MHVISIDWLSLYVDTSQIRIPQSYGMERAEYGTSVYNDVITYTMGGEEMAVLAYNPRSSALKKDTGVLKIINAILYLPNLDRIIARLLDETNIHYISVSRCDLCADFHGFNDYPNIQNFIADFLTTKIWKIGQAKYKIMGEQGSKHNYQYLRFGSNTSDIAAYLYNKSQEFRDVKRKNYIAENWYANGLDESQDVWRLEFSMKGNGLKFLNQESGEFETKSLNMILDKELRLQMYNALFLKYFVFRYNDGQVRKDRMKHCNLLDIDGSIFKPRAISMADETTKEHKRMISAMERTYDELRIKAQTRNMEVEAVIEKFTSFTNLRRWRANKFGAKYAEMDAAEHYLKEQEREAANSSPSPTPPKTAVK